MAAGLVDSYHPLVDGDLTLRRAVPADAADICEVYGEADTRHWMLWEGEDPPDEAEALATVERSERAWAEGWGEVFRIVVDGHVVGGAMIRFTLLPRQRDHIRTLDGLMNTAQGVCG